MSSFTIIAGTQLDDASTHSGLVLLDFWQASCAPCRPLEPRLERVAEARPGQFTGYRIDVDTDTVNRSGVMSIPTIVPLRDGHEVARLDGLIREQEIEETLLARAAD